jgi:hypothetical protein
VKQECARVSLLARAGRLASPSEVGQQTLIVVVGTSAIESFWRSDEPELRSLVIQEAEVDAGRNPDRRPRAQRAAGAEGGAALLPRVSSDIAGEGST